MVFLHYVIVQNLVRVSYERLHLLSFVQGVLLRLPIHPSDLLQRFQKRKLDVLGQFCHFVLDALVEELLHVNRRHRDV
jgi:hypothetical protein